MDTATPHEEPARVPTGSEPKSEPSSGVSLELAALYVRFHKPLYRIARGLTLRPEQAEDVEHQAFLSLHRYVEREGGWGVFARPEDDDDRSVLNPRSAASGRVLAFLVTAARNRFVDELRATRRETACDPEELPDLPDPAADSSSLHRRNEEWKALLAAFGRVEPRDILLVMLREAFELSHEDIGAWVGLATESVGRSLDRARERLRDAAGAPPRKRRGRRRAASAAAPAEIT